MKSVFVGKIATVLDGDLRGTKGVVIYANSKTKVVQLSLQNGRDSITTSFDNIEQEERGGAGVSKNNQQLPPERWLEAAENLEKVFPAIAKKLLLMNHEGCGKEDAEEFMNDANLALMALKYVGNFASDKCRFITIP